MFPLETLHQKHENNLPDDSQKFSKEVHTKLERKMFRKVNLLRNVLVKPTPSRSLYTETALGVDNYIIGREKIKQQFTEQNEQKFREKMQEFSSDKPGNMIFTEDLKHMAHLVSKTPEDMDLINKMLLKYNSQNKELRFGLFVFGPVIMRMFYHLNEVDAALKLFKDPNMEGFFDQLISFQLILDMLYENKRYEEVLEIFDFIRSKQIQGGRYPKHSVVLAFAACYKLNTPNSFEYCTTLWKNLAEVGHMPMRKAATFAAGLAVEQNAPEVALEILSTIKDQYYVSVRNLKVITYAQLGRPDNAIPILRNSINVDEPVFKKRTFVKRAIEELKKSIVKNAEKDLEADFSKIEKTLIQNGQINDDTIEQLLCSEITSTSLNGQNRNRGVIAASFNEANNNNTNRKPRFNPQRPQRMGLNDMY